MIDISCIENRKRINHTSVSLCGKLDVFIGGYFISGVLPDSNVETLYHDASIDSVYEDDFLTDV